MYFFFFFAPPSPFISMSPNLTLSTCEDTDLLLLVTASATGFSKVSFSNSFLKSSSDGYGARRFGDVFIRVKF